MFTLRIIRNKYIQNAAVLIVQASGPYSYRWAKALYEVNLYHHSGRYMTEMYLIRSKLIRTVYKTKIC
jgi:hypothetical protein